MSQKNDPDLFEEFEFRPLSAGLGFHKKNSEEENSSSLTASKPSTASRSDSMENISGLRMPLPRDGGQSKRTTSSAGSAGNSPLVENLKGVFEDKLNKRIKQNRIWDIDDQLMPKDSKESLQGTEIGSSPSQTEDETTEWKKTSFDLTALLVDSFLISAIFLLSLAVFSTTTGIDVVHGLTNNTLDPDIIFAMMSLLGVIAWIYMVASRAFAGVTAGEFIFDHRLGLPSQTLKASYGWKVALRTSILFATGLVILPLMEEITGKDILGKVLKLSHFRKVPNGNRSNS